MPTIYVNGGAPNYAGFEFTTANQLIDKLELELGNAGWIILSKVAGTSLFARGVKNTYNCWIEFTINTNAGQTNGRFLDLRGWLEEGKTNGSPTATHRLEFIEGSLNRLWLSANNEAGCVCIYPPVGTCKGIHFGFLDLILPTDQFGWMIGEIRSLSYGAAYVAKSFISQTNWRQLSLDFNVYNTLASAGNIPLTTFDYLRQIAVLTAGNIFTTTTNTNSQYFGDRGSINPVNNNCIILPYGYLEGRGSTTSYGSTGNNNLPFRGAVQFAYTGVSALNSAIPVIDPSSNKIILSTGDPGWQGMEIA